MIGESPSTPWLAAHFAVVIPAHIGLWEVPEQWKPGAFRGSPYPILADLHDSPMGGGGDATQWFPGRLAEATATAPWTALSDETPEHPVASARWTLETDEATYTHENVSVVALEVLRFTSPRSYEVEDFVTAHLVVNRPTSRQLLLISQNLRRPRVDPFGDAGGDEYAKPMSLILSAINKCIVRQDDVPVVRIDRSGRVVRPEQLKRRNPVVDRAHVTVSVSAVASRSPEVDVLGNYQEPLWTPELQWAHAIGYGGAPGMQWPSDSRRSAESLSVDCPKDWTGVVTEIGQAFICVDSDPTAPMFRGFWHLGQTRFVDLMLLANRQVHILECLSESLVTLGKSTYESARRADELDLGSVTDLRREIEGFVRDYSAFRNNTWFTIVPRRNRATDVLIQLHERLHAHQLLEEIDSELQRLSQVISVIADRRVEEHERAIRSHQEAQEQLLLESAHRQELERDRRDWLVSVISALVGLPSVTYALAAISTTPTVRNGALWTLGWIVLCVPTVLVVYWVISRTRRLADRTSGKQSPTVDRGRIPDGEDECQTSQ